MSSPAMGRYEAVATTSAAGTDLVKLGSTDSGAPQLQTESTSRGGRALAWIKDKLGIGGNATERAANQSTMADFQRALESKYGRIGSQAFAALNGKVAAGKPLTVADIRTVTSSAARLASDLGPDLHGAMMAADADAAAARASQEKAALVAGHEAGYARQIDQLLPRMWDHEGNGARVESLPPGDVKAIKQNAMNELRAHPGWASSEGPRPNAFVALKNAVRDYTTE